MSENDIVLEARELHKVYESGGKKLHVLKGINVKVTRSEILAIVGPSGAGKSTLLHLLGGLDRPTSGEVFLEGANLFTIKDNERAKIRNKKVGFVFQFYHLLPEFTALENVLLPGVIQLQSEASRSQGKRKELKNNAVRLLAELGLERRMTHKPSQLSGGEQQRVAIARALMNSPDILFCDEPTGNLDSKTGQEICDLLQQLNEERGQTCIIVTHEETIVNYADRMIHLRDGRLVNEKHIVQ